MSFIEICANWSMLENAIRLMSGTVSCDLENKKHDLRFPASRQFRHEITRSLRDAVVSTQIKGQSEAI
jgi:hypothetical protein